MKDEPKTLTGTELRMAIATEILGWKMAIGAVPPDFHGKNGGDLLTPDGKPFKWSGTYPNIGEVHPAFHIQAYDRDYWVALDLARIVQLPDRVCDICHSAEKLSQRCLEYWRTTRGQKQ